MKDINCIAKLNGVDESLVFKRITLLTGMNGIGKSGIVSDFIRKCGLPNIINNYDGSTYWKWVNFKKGIVSLNEEAVDALVKSTGGVDCLIFTHPENDLHPKSQSNFGYAMALLSVRTGARIVVETHSPHVFNGIRLALLDSKCPIGIDELSWYHFYNLNQLGDKATLYENMSIDEEGNVDGKAVDSFFDCPKRHLEDLLEMSENKLSRNKCLEKNAPLDKIPFKVGDETFNFNKVTVVCGREGLGKSKFIETYAMERKAETGCEYKLFRGSDFLKESVIDDPNVKVVVFDHPENDMHVELQFSFGLYMALLADVQDLQVVVETNSVEVINGMTVGLCLHATNIDYRAFTAFFFHETKEKFEVVEVSLDDGGNLSDLPVDFPGDQLRQDCRDIAIIRPPTEEIGKKLEKFKLEEQEKYSKE